MKSLSLATLNRPYARTDIHPPASQKERAPAPRQPAPKPTSVSDVQLSSERRAPQQAQNQQSGAPQGTRTGPCASASGARDEAGRSRDAQ